MPKRAVVVIHGIGQHQPYQMSRALTDGLLRIAQQKGVNAVVDQIVPVGQPSSQAPPGRIYRFIIAASKDTYVDVYEAYWAPLVAGLTSFLGIVWWLVINTFIPSRMIGRPNRKTLFDVAVSAFFLTIITVLYYWLFGALLQTTTDVLERRVDSSSLHLLWDSWTAPARVPLGVVGLGSLSRVFSPIMLGWLIATSVGVYALFQFIFRIAELVTDRAGVARNWIAYVGGLAGWIIVYLLARGSVTSEFFAYGYIYVVFRVVNLWIKKYFVDYIGDIEVYVTSDSKSARFMAREQIRGRAVDAIKAAVTSTENYDEVFVFGHSLGSVVGLDALREVRREAGTVLTEEQFGRLRGFVTFGSPLEKTRFFFERISPDGGDRWKEFLRDIQDTFLQRMGHQPAKPPGEVHRIYWTNFWYFADLVSNSLESYNSGLMHDLVEVRELRQPGLNPWVHSAYFVDDEFLRPTYEVLVETQ